MDTNDITPIMPEGSEENKPQGQESPELDAEQSRKWEENHEAIMTCMHKHMLSKMRIPTISFIANETGISRFTVRKHLREFSAQPDFQEHAGMFKFMTTNILRQLYAQSMSGEVKAARLYMELMGVLKYNAVVENNFIHVKPKSLTLDGVAITEEFLNSVSPSLRDKLADVMRECVEDVNKHSKGAA